MTLLTHTQPHRSVYSSKKNYQHCRGPLSGFMRESGFQAQSKFYRKKNQRSTKEITSHNFIHQRGAARSFSEGIQGVGQLDMNSFVNAIYLHD